MINKSRNQIAESLGMMRQMTTSAGTSASAAYTIGRHMETLYTEASKPEHSWETFKQVRSIGFMIDRRLLRHQV